MTGQILAVRGLDLVLDVQGARRKRGAVAMTFPPHGEPNQLFTLDGAGRLSPMHAPQLCLDAKGGKLTEGAELIFWSWKGGGSDNQAFAIDGDGFLAATASGGGGVVGAGADTDAANEGRLVAGTVPGAADPLCGGPLRLCARSSTNALRWDWRTSAEACDVTTDEAAPSSLPLPPAAVPDGKASPCGAAATAPPPPSLRSHTGGGRHPAPGLRRAPSVRSAGGGDALMLAVQARDLVLAAGTAAGAAARHPGGRGGAGLTGGFGGFSIFGSDGAAATAAALPPTGEARQRFYLDSRGRLRPGHDAGLCLEAKGHRLRPGTHLVFGRAREGDDGVVDDDDDDDDSGGGGSGAPPSSQVFRLDSEGVLCLVSPAEEKRRGWRALLGLRLGGGGNAAAGGVELQDCEQQQQQQQQQQQRQASGGDEESVLAVGARFVSLELLESLEKQNEGSFSDPGCLQLELVPRSDPRAVAWAWRPATTAGGRRAAARLAKRLARRRQVLATAARLEITIPPGAAPATIVALRAPLGALGPGLKGRSFFFQVPEGSRPGEAVEVVLPRSSLVDPAARWRGAAALLRVARVPSAGGGDGGGGGGGGGSDGGGGGRWRRAAALFRAAAHLAAARKGTEEGKEEEGDARDMEATNDSGAAAAEDAAAAAEDAAAAAAALGALAFTAPPTALELFNAEDYPNGDADQVGRAGCRAGC